MNLLDTPAEEAFDRLTRLAAQTLGVPVALATLLDEERQVFRGQCGVPEPWASRRETPLSYSFCKHVVTSGEPLIIEDAREHPLVRDSPAIPDLGVIAYAGIPLRDRAGQVLGAFCAIDTRPRRWAAEEIQVLSDFAAAAATEMQWRTAREGESQFRVLADTAPEAILTMDAESVIRSANPAVERIFGYTAPEIVGQPLSILIPERFREAHAAGLRRYLQTGKRNIPWKGVELSGLTRSGEEIPLEISFGEYLHEGERVFTGFVRDIRERKQAAEAVRRSEERFRSLAEATAQIVWVTDRGGMLLTDQRDWGAFTGQRVEEYRGWGWLTAIHPDDRGRTAAAWCMAVDEESSYEVEHRVRRHDGEYRVFSVRGVAVREADGFVREWVGTHTDITARLRAEEERHFLGEASRVLASSLDHDTTLLAVAQLAVSRIADWCGVDLLEGHTVRRVAVAHADPAKEEIARRLREYPFRADAPAGPPQVIRTGEAELYPEIPDALLEAIARDPEHQRILRMLGMRSGISVPLIGRDQVLGAVTFVSAESGRRYGPEDLKLAEELASRAAVAVDHARLFRLAEQARGHLEQQATELEIQMEELQSQAVQLEEGQAELEIAHDELRGTHAELAVAEAHYRRLVENAPYAVYVLNREGRFTELNQASSVITGREPVELIGRSITEIVAPEDLPDLAVFLRRTLSGDVELSDLELHVVHTSGEYRLVHIRGTAVREDGRSIGTHGIARDITAERARDEERHLLATALESLEEGVSITTFAGETLYANEKHARLLGYDPAGGALPRREAFVPDADEARRQEEILRTVAAEGRWVGRIRGRRLDDGGIVPLEAIVGRVDRPGKDPGVLLAILRDVTEEIDREKRLRRAERLAGVGTLIAGVAHELNNPLAAIKGFTELLLLDPRAREEREDLETIRREADRMAKIVSNLKMVARETQGEDNGAREAVDLNEVVRHALKVRRYALETHNVEVREDLEERLPRVWVNRSEIEQVVLNLIVNAEQALASTGENERRLTVRTCPRRTGAAVHIVDNGPGIAPEHLERIFDPFFTTKAPGEGTGLGLSLVHSMVADAGGEIRVASEPGQGAAFMVDLPRVVEEGPEEDQQCVQDVAPVLGRRILIVDDEEAIRRSVSRFLSRRGHRVETAAEGGEALRLLDSAASGEPYDVILSDLRMPGLSGEELLRRLREQGGGMAERVIFMTGDAASEGAARFLQTAGVPTIEKPFDLAEIARRMEHYAEGRGV